MPLSPEESDAIEATVKGALAPVNDLVIRAFGPLADQVGDILGDYGRMYRTKQLLKILQRTQRIANRAAVEVKVIPPRILLPSVHFASLEDGDELQEKWAALLTNAADNPDLIHNTFPDILHSLSPAEVRFLDSILESGREVARAAAPSEIALDNLQRLGLLTYIPPAAVLVNGTGKREATYILSAFGKAFVAACRQPRSR